MLDNDDFWDFYWETRLRPMENLGKRAAILAASALIRRLAPHTNHPLRLLELGCGEGQVIGTLLDAHAQVCALRTSVGVDYKPASLAVCQRDFPALRCVEGDFTNPHLLAGLGAFEIVLLVNALHEVFSDSLHPAEGGGDVPTAKKRVEQALAGAASCLTLGGWLVLFDGLEPAGDPRHMLRVRFHNRQAREDFETFAQEYQPFQIVWRPLADPLSVELSQHDFTRYITKSIFLRKGLWKTERFESYQYFTEAEYRAAFTRQRLVIRELRKLTVNEDKWRQLVDIEASEVAFPDEHILILAQREPQQIIREKNDI